MSYVVKNLGRALVMHIACNTQYWYVYMGILHLHFNEFCSGHPKMAAISIILFTIDMEMVSVQKLRHEIMTKKDNLLSYTFNNKCAIFDDLCGQMVWNNTAEMGCGMSKSASGDTFVVCKYGLAEGIHACVCVCVCTYTIIMKLKMGCRFSTRRPCTIKGVKQMDQNWIMLDASRIYTCCLL